MRDDARKFALQYDADRVLKEHWVPVLRELLDEDDSPSLGIFAQANAGV